LFGTWSWRNRKLGITAAEVILEILFQTTEKDIAAGPGQFLFLDTVKQVVLNLIIGKIGSR